MAKFLLFLSLIITESLSPSIKTLQISILKAVNHSIVMIDRFSDSFTVQKRRTVRRRTVQRRAPRRNSTAPRNNNYRGFFSGLFAGSILGNLFGGSMYGGGGGSFFILLLFGGLIYLFFFKNKGHNPHSRHHNYNENINYDNEDEEIHEEEIIEEIIEEIYEDGKLVEIRKITKDANDNIIDSVIEDKREK